MRLSIVAAACGLGIGFVGGGFRRILLSAGTARLSLVHWAHQFPWAGWLAPVLMVAVCATLARLLIHFLPVASGSGIQDVEAVWRGDVEPPPWTLLPTKFVGGALAIGSGMALGREGPTVHMGAVMGSEAARRLKMDDSDGRILQTALGGAGLAVAFNAPLGGSLFVFEEVAKVFKLRLALATLIGSSVAIACSRVLVPGHAEFAVGRILAPPGWLIIVYVVFGAATGLLGMLYNRLVLTGLDLFARFVHELPGLRAAIVGGGVGLVLWFQPLAVGGGDVLVQRVLAGGMGLSVLVSYFAVRFLIGPWSYSAGTPGGLFAPLLAVGAVWGALAQGILVPVIPMLGNHPGEMAIVGMATFFTAVVRAPFTGIVLIVEMTATTSLLVPMLAASFAALLVTTVLGSEPIYDSLRARMPRSRR